MSFLSRMAQLYVIKSGAWDIWPGDDVYNSSAAYRLVESNFQVNHFQSPDILRSSSGNRRSSHNLSLHLETFGIGATIKGFPR